MKSDSHSKTKAANKRPGVDAGWLVLLAFERHRSGTTQVGRYARGLD